MAIIQKVHRFGSKINACMIKENWSNLKEVQYDVTSTYGRILSMEYLEIEMKNVESILSTRLTDETFRRIINFQKAVILETPIHEIQKALVNI